MPPLPKPDARQTRYAATQACRQATIASAIVQKSSDWEDPDGGRRRTMPGYTPPNTYNAELSDLRLHAVDLLRSARLLCHALGVKPDPSEYEAAALIRALVQHAGEEGDIETAGTLDDQDFQRTFGQRMGWVEP